MVMTAKDAGELVGGILLDAAKTLNERAAGRGKRLVATMTSIGMQFVEVDADKPEIKMVCNVCEDEPCTIYTFDGKAPDPYSCDDAVFKVVK